MGNYLLHVTRWDYMEVFMAETSHQQVPPSIGDILAVPDHGPWRCQHVLFRLRPICTSEA
jgi:hypothetical protein